jgi:hypothetical protein
MDRIFVAKLLLGMTFILGIVIMVEGAFALAGRGSVNPYLPFVCMLTLFAGLFLGRVNRRQGGDDGTQQRGEGK